MARATPARPLAKRLRHAPTFNERVLWKLLRNRRLEELKFRRQVPLGRYVADFACFSHRLIVEADGPLHDTLRDAERDAWLAAEGFSVLRVPNSRVTLYPDLVLDDIRRWAGLAP
jgi:very-short-patch-repair endonuclease